MKIEFKIKDDDKNWEDTPVYITVEIDERKNVDDFAQRLSRMFEKEVRWNFEGLSQGHYVEEQE
jgi:hypothetical protein